MALLCPRVQEAEGRGEEGLLHPYPLPPALINFEHGENFKLAVIKKGLISRIFIDSC